MSDLAAELHMSRSQKITNLLGVTIPFAGFLASIFFLWGSYVTWRDLTIFAVGYALTTLGISIGFHRLFTHRSYETFRSIRYGPPCSASMAVQGPVIRWVSTTASTSFADWEGDPHSPHAGFGPGVRGKLAGLWHAHVGWLFRNVGRAEWTKYAKDLLADRGMVFVSRWFGLWVALAALALPRRVVWGGTLGAGLQAMFWGGLIRIFLLHHITWSVNPSATSSARAASASRTSRATSGGSPGSPSASRGTTTTTPPPPPSTACRGARHRRPRDQGDAAARARLEGERADRRDAAAPPRRPLVGAWTPGDACGSPLTLERRWPRRSTGR